MTCASCDRYRPHKEGLGIGVCRDMDPRRGHLIVIAGDSRCYFAKSKWTAKTDQVQQPLALT